MKDLAHGSGQMLRRRTWLLVLIPSVLGGVVGALSFRPGVYLPAHRHCIKMAGLGFHMYADSHEGAFPRHPDGYGDALLLLDESCLHSVTGPGDDPDVLREAKAAGRGLPESSCGRVYVQGLGTKSNPQLVVLFDKLATPGGDHCHFPARLWAKRGREVMYVNGQMGFVADDQWPAFAAEQVDLLVEEGVERDEAERLYAQAIR